MKIHQIIQFFKLKPMAAETAGYMVSVYYLVFMYYFLTSLHFQISIEQVERLTDHCNIEKFKKNDAVNFQNGFIRKGHVGDWVNHFKNEEKLKDFDLWIANNNIFEIPIKYKKK